VRNGAKGRSRCKKRKWMLRERGGLLSAAVRSVWVSGFVKGRCWLRGQTAQLLIGIEGGISTKDSALDCGLAARSCLCRGTLEKGGREEQEGERAAVTVVRMRRGERSVSKVAWALDRNLQGQTYLMLPNLPKVAATGASLRTANRVGATVRRAATTGPFDTLLPTHKLFSTL